MLRYRPFGSSHSTSIYFQRSITITVHPEPKDPRTDDITGDVVREGKVQADWGLHLIDVNLAMGNLIDVVREQSKSYRAVHKSD